MMHNHHWSQAAYDLSIRLYPPAFRTEFGGEMRAAFAEALADAAGAGAAGIARLWLRELCDLPGSLLRAHWHARSASCRPSGPRPASFARWGALGFGIGFALLQSMPEILGPALQPYRAMAPLIGMILCLSAGALSGALLGMPSRSRRTILCFALAGSLAFALERSLALALSARATDSTVSLSSFDAGVLTLLHIARPVLIGALVGVMTGAAQKRWKDAARLAFIGGSVFGLGSLGGAVLQVAPWVAAQAAASYQAAPANAWLAAVPFYLAILASVVTGIVGGACLGLNVGRNRIVADR